MKRSQNHVVTMPIEALWDESGETISERVGPLTSSGIADLLRTGPVRFVVADVGRPLQWIAPNRCFEFWKEGLKHNVCEDGKKRPLDTYPGSYCFLASLWRDTTAGAVVLLEKHH